MTRDLNLLLTVALVGLAGYRLAVLVSDDDITEPLRRWLWRRAYPGMPYELAGEVEDWQQVRTRRFWEKVYEGVSCPLCTGVWATAGAWWCWWGWPEPWSSGLVALAAAMGLQAFLAKSS